ncbi:MAG: hypothetical protein ACRDRY_22510 [Pseudonocardiaceae bacterium]
MSLQRRMLTEADREEISRGIAEGLGHGDRHADEAGATMTLCKYRQPG